MADLERELRELSGWLATPEPPDVRTQVRARIAAPPASTVDGGGGGTRWA
ncbi:hypothetical protein [Micromonospora endophytica]|nr:hypothetical protein [Micromonospora endophytica]